MNPLRTAVALCDDITATTVAGPVLGWTWGPALLGFALAQLDDHLRQPRYLPWLERYAEYHRQHPPAINSSDTVAPALVTWSLERQGLDRFGPLTARAVDYVRTAPCAVEDAVNHLGRSPWTVSAVEDVGPHRVPGSSCR